MVLTLNGAPIQPKPAPAPLDREAPDRVVLFMRLVALNLEARRDLAEAVRRRRKLEGKLADPANRDHPGRPAAERKLERREADERQAAVRLIETNVSLSRCWDTIAPDDKAKYALTFLVGESDPAMPVLQTLYRDDVGLARLVPFPEGWAVPHSLAHLSLDDGPSIRTYTYDEILNAEYPPF